ncbi:MAG TPA: hypothetical protein VGK67_01345 [Myxococcales bacterium]
MEPKRIDAAATAVTLNADGTRTVLCPDGTKVTLAAGFARGADLSIPEDSASPSPTWSPLAA